MLTVVTSHTGIQGTWYKNDEMLSNTDSITIQISGNYQVLVISNVQSSDSGIYTFTANGESTSAYLTVIGKYLIVVTKTLYNNTKSNALNGKRKNVLFLSRSSIFHWAIDSIIKFESLMNSSLK